MKNHAIKNQAIAKKKINKDSTAQRKLAASVNTCSPQRYSSKLTEFSIVDEKSFHQSVHQSEKLFFDQTNDFDVVGKDNAQNSLDLMEISKCILGIEDEKTMFNNFEPIEEKCFSSNETNMSSNSTDEFVSIEAIKKFLTDPSVKYIDLTLQEHMNADYYNSF